MPPRTNNQSSGSTPVNQVFAKLTTIAPKAAPYRVPLPPTATQTTISIEFKGENSPGLMIPTWGTYKAPASPANIAATTNAKSL